METFFTFLERRVDDCSSLLCVGLDPHVDDLASPTAAAAQEFCLRLIHSTSAYAAAFKPNAAFFETLGPEGWLALKTVIDAIRAESVRLGSRIPVILDAKRGDIASTAEAYARSAFDVLGADAITLSPYLGRDAIGFQNMFLIAGGASFLYAWVFLLFTKNVPPLGLKPLPVGVGGREIGLQLPEIAVFSGDTVRRDEDGFLYFIGRRDEMMKTSGYRVSPTEVEEILYETKRVGECVAFGVEHATLGQAIQVIVTPPADGSLEVEALLAECRARMPAYMVPAGIEVRQGPLPRNPNGKIDRKTLSTEWIEAHGH